MIATISELKQMMELFWREGQIYNPLAVSEWSEFRLKWECERLRQARPMSIVDQEFRAIPSLPISLYH